jgi:hypothetical protein
MDAGAWYLLAADAILFLHAAFVAFIGGGLLLIFVGRLLNWSWVRNPWFRLAHLTGIGVVVLQSWLGIVCPVTTWEMALRAKAGGAVYAGSFVSHWLSVLLYYDAPQWVFAVCYTLFGLLVVVSWSWVRPHPFKRSGGTR